MTKGKKTSEISSSIDDVDNYAGKEKEIDLLAHTINSISEAITITDLENNIIYVNDAFVKMYGYSREEIAGLNVEILRTDSDVGDSPSDIIGITISKGWHGKLKNKRRDGTIFPIELLTSTVKDENGQPMALVGVVRDITELVTAEESLKEAQQKYKNLFLELKDAVYESTPDGKLLELNPSGLELFGFTSLRDLHNVNIAADLYCDIEDRNKFKEVLEKKGYVKNYEIDIKRRNGEIITVLETATAVKDINGNIIAYRGILRDVSEIKKAETKLKHLVSELELLNVQLVNSEKELKNLNSSKDKFFSIIAHDLRSPFTSLLSFSEFLIEDLDELSKEEITSFATKIHESASTVFKLLENLLNWSRIQTGKMICSPIKFNISSRVNAAIKLLANNIENKDITVSNLIDTSFSVHADEDMVFSVIQNLLSNAVKFTNRGGTIDFKSSRAEELILIEIADTGVGISERDLDLLFRIDAHHTTYGTEDEKGSGLGLILCKEMIERNNGWITIKSKPGEGTSITFALPGIQ